jgi:hypothetical protein
VAQQSLEERVSQFHTCRLPGQAGIHMGTAALIDDLWKEILTQRDAARKSQSHADRLRTLLSSSRGEQGWRTIDEDTPKGRKVIVSVPNGRNHKPITMMARYWRHGTFEVAEGYEGEDWAVEVNGEYYMPEGWYEECEVEDAPAHNINPTHWMPLPSAPGSVPTSTRSLSALADELKLVSDFLHDPDADGLMAVVERAIDVLQGSVPTSLAGQGPDGWDRIIATLREFSSLRAADGDYWEADAADRAAKEIERIAREALIAAPQPTAGGDAPK